MHCRAGEARDRFIMQQREAAQMCWEREILIAYIFKTASLVWMGGTIKQNRAINWGHLESCHFPFCARLFASIQKYSVVHCQCCVIPAEVPCTRIKLSICTGMPTPIWRGTLSTRLLSLSGLNGGTSMLWPTCFPGDSETLVERGDKQITITFIGKKYNTGESGTIIL